MTEKTLALQTHLQLHLLLLADGRDPDLHGIIELGIAIMLDIEGCFGQEGIQYLVKGIDIPVAKSLLHSRGSKQEVKKPKTQYKDQYRTKDKFIRDQNRLIFFDIVKWDASFLQCPIGPKDPKQSHN